MIYELEKRGNSLVMPTRLYNFLMQNKVKFSYDFENSGINLDEDIVERIRTLGNDDFISQTIKYTTETQKTLKTQNTRLHKRRLI